MRTSLSALMESDETVLTDGAMGTMLFDQGLPQGEAPELWNLERPQVVQQVHEAYIAAGAQIILTNSFGANRRRLQLHGFEDRVEALNEAAAKLAVSAAEAAERPILVAGSIGPTGSFLQPLGDMRFDEAVGIYKTQAAALRQGGVDVFWIETMYDLGEIEAAVIGCRQADSDAPVISTMTFDSGGRTMMGTTPEAVVEKLRELGVVSLGGNCGNGPLEVEETIEAMHNHNGEVVLIAKANAGIPRLEGGVPVYDADPAEMARYALRAREFGARIIGACCGSTPAHIQAMASALQNGRASE